MPCQGKKDKYIKENLQYMYFNDEHGIFMKSYKLIRLERTVVCNLNSTYETIVEAGAVSNAVWLPLSTHFI